MTCIVGIKRAGNGVMLGGDTQGSAGWDATARLDTKVFAVSRHLDDVPGAVGFTTSYRMGQVLRFGMGSADAWHDLTNADHSALTDADEGDYAFAWAVSKYVPAARTALKDAGYTKISDNREEEAGTFLLAVGPHLFSIGGDWQVAWPRDEFAAVGCGADYALGALHAMEDVRLTVPFTPVQRAAVALGAADRFSNGVGAPYEFVTTSTG